jgi:hypothetical protein
MKRLYLAVASSLLIIGCAGNTTKHTPTPSADSVTPKPISAVFNHRTGPTTVEFGDNGQFISITSKASAPIAGNNAFSVEQATQVATLRAKRNVSEFLNSQINSTRTLKVLSRTVQKSKEDTSNGMSDETVVSDKEFDENGELITSGANKQSPVSAFDNLNTEKVAQSVTETISNTSVSILRGLITTNEEVSATGRTVVVEVKASVNTISAAGNLRKLMEAKGE